MDEELKGPPGLCRFLQLLGHVFCQCIGLLA